MKHKSLLMKLADHLDTVKRRNFNMCSLSGDALYHATTLPEFKKAGLVYEARDKEEPGLRRVWYKNASDTDAAMLFFDITRVQAEYLFGEVEVTEDGSQNDPRSLSPKSLINPFTGTQFRGWTKGQKGDSFGEAPGWTANRIRSFVVKHELVDA